MKFCEFLAFLKWLLREIAIGGAGGSVWLGSLEELWKILVQFMFKDIGIGTREGVLDSIWGKTAPFNGAV